MSLPTCPECNSAFAYEYQGLLVCPECGHEWDPQEGASSEEQEATLQIKDANGNPLLAGDKVTLIKDLKVKASSAVLKIGTKATIKQLVDADHDIDCKVDGAGDMMLKSQFVKKA